MIPVSELVEDEKDWPLRVPLVMPVKEFVDQLSALAILNVIINDEITNKIFEIMFTLEHNNYFLFIQL